MARRHHHLAGLVEPEMASESYDELQGLYECSQQMSYTLDSDELVPMARPDSAFQVPLIVGEDHEAAQLERVLQNLLRNAITFRGQEPPVVHIGAEREGEMWVLSVRDNGMGIAPQFVERIFLIFQRLHGQHIYPGTGMGLAICKKIIERHGGRIWVESQSDQGATFFLLCQRAICHNRQ